MRHPSAGRIVQPEHKRRAAVRLSHAGSRAVFAVIGTGIGERETFASSAPLTLTMKETSGAPSSRSRLCYGHHSTGSDG
jgi:hypothetical protein